MAAKNVIELDEYQAKVVQHAVLVGLRSLGIIEEIQSYAEVSEASGTPWREEQIPLHPTGGSDTVSMFAEALTYLER